jgi:hypothetical protein
MTEMTGYIVYKDLVAMQHDNFYSVFEKFLREIKPDRILEIGTAGGGTILALNDIMLSLNKPCEIRTYDISGRSVYSKIIETGIDLRIENIFTDDYKLRDVTDVISFIQSSGTTLVLCDGGYKVAEFNVISDYLKPGDFIMAHDYSKSREFFEENINGKIWNWCEIVEDDIAEASKKNQLEGFMDEEFQSIVWVCKTKKGNNYSVKPKKNLTPKRNNISTDKSNFTLVTGLWDIRRGELKDFNRSFDHYLDNFSKLLSLDFNMCVYVPKELTTFVDTHRSNKNTTIIVYDLEDIKNNFDFFDIVQDIRKDENWYKRASWLENSPQAKLEYYNPIVMSKFFFLHDCSVRNEFKTDYFFWIDAGLTNTVDLNMLKNLSSIENYMKKIKNKFLFLSFPYENDNEVHGFESSKFAEFCGVDKTEYVCRGGFFGGHKDRVKKLNGEYYNLASDTLKSGYMGTEENFHTMLTYHNPNDTHRFELSDNGLVYPFFEMLSEVEEYSVPNSELILWNKKKTAEELKTSLYVLTYNSPEQFETLIESYRHGESDFLDRTRKILIDNSTDSSTYEKYNSLCKTHKFEHIKKEINLGISGARQFVAEHFNESDSEYYIFLEDDMTIHGSTEELCDSGFKRHVDNLYLKSLEIMHRNRYDYLKLSYSEFYGTNETQWAWYNIPRDVREKYFPEKTKLPEEGLDSDPPKTEIFCEKRYKDLKYFEGEFYYCNWPLWFSRQGNKKVFLDTKWAYPNEHTWMSHIFQLQKQGKIRAAVLALSPIFHHRFDFYAAEDRKES